MRKAAVLLLALFSPVQESRELPDMGARRKSISLAYDISHELHEYLAAAGSPQYFRTGQHHIGRAEHMLSEKFQYVDIEIRLAAAGPDRKACFENGRPAERFMKFGYGDFGGDEDKYFGRGEPGPGGHYRLRAKGAAIPAEKVERFRQLAALLAVK